MSQNPIVLEVGLGDRAYELWIGDDLTHFVTEWLEEEREGASGLALLVDETISKAWGEWIERVFPGVPQMTFPSGEGTKSWEHLMAAVDFLASLRMDRGGAVIALGGGVLGDLAGFAAAVFLRGIRYVQIPTTLLAMVDSSIGGKTGINLAAGKNLVGAFHQPSRVFIQTDFLKTLPQREFAAGMAEVAKYGLLGERGLFEDLEGVGRDLSPNHPFLPEVIERCCRIKAGIVAADERETAQDGGRAVLNLGHTFAHAIEKTAGFGTYLHGEAVAIGLVMAADLSLKLGQVEPSVPDRVRALLAELKLPISLREPIPVPDLLTAMGSDKKVRAGRLTFVILQGIGQAAVTSLVEANQVESVLREAGAEDRPT